MSAPAPRVARLARLARILAIACAAGALSASLVRAGVAMDISVGLPIGDDAKLFLNLTNEYYAPPPDVATVLVRRCPHPEDDFPAVLFLARASGRPPQEILEMRLGGRPWADIMVAAHVSPSVLFVGIERDPGPPYGRAWGSWRRHPRGRLPIEDPEFVELAKLRVASGYYHLSPWRVIEERRRGVAVERFAAERHRERAREHREKRDEHRGRKDKGRGEHGNPHDQDERGQSRDRDR